MSCFTGRISAGISDHSTVAFEVAHVAPIQLKFGVEDVDSSAQISSLLVQRWRVGPKNIVRLTKYGNITNQQRRILCAILT